MFFSSKMGQIAGFTTLSLSLLCANQRHQLSEIRDLCFYTLHNIDLLCYFTQSLPSVATWQSEHLGIGQLSFSPLIGHSPLRLFVFLSDIDSHVDFLVHFLY